MSVNLIKPLLTEDRRRSFVMVIILMGALLLGIFIEADPRQATLCGLRGPYCPLGATIGEAACPGCGPTRSTALLLDGKWRAATSVHPAGWVVIVCCLLGVFVHVDILRRGRRTRIHRVVLPVGHGLFVTGLAVAWLLRLVSLV